MSARRLLSGSATAALLAAMPALPAAEPPALVDLPPANAAEGFVVEPPAAADSIPDVDAADTVDRPLDRAFRVRLSEAGSLPVTVRMVDPATGDVVPATGMTLSFLSGGQVPAAWEGPAGVGTVAVTAAAGADGKATVAGLTPGIYSVVGRGTQGYLAFGLDVLPAGPADGQTSRLDVIASPAADVATISGLAARYMRAAGDAPVGAPAATAERVAPAARVPGPRTVNFEETEDLEGLKAPTKRPVLKIGADGSARGRLVALYDGTGLARPVDLGRVFMIRGGSVAAQVTPNERGEFTVTGLTDGVYTLAALSPIGVAAVGIEVETAEEVDVADSGAFRNVAMRRVVKQNNDDFETAIVPPLDGGFTLFDVPVGPVRGFAPGGSGLGGFGGAAGAAGGGAAGGGLPGGLLLPLLIGGGVAAAIAASDDDDGDVEAASPSAPSNGADGGDGGNGEED